MWDKVCFQYSAYKAPNNRILLKQKKPDIGLFCGEDGT